MPMPTVVRHINKHVFNRWEMARGNRPVLVHVGRTSGKRYQTPLEPRPTPGGYAFILMYGAAKTDWVKNTLHSGGATLLVNGEEVRLSNPLVVVGERGWIDVPKNDERPPEMLKITEILRMDVITS